MKVRVVDRNRGSKFDKVPSDIEDNQDMPVMKCKRDGKDGYKYGDGGFCFVGEGAEGKAKAQGRAIKAKENKNK